MDYREHYGRGRERRYREQSAPWERGDYDRRGEDDRGFLERLADELRSWFRDEEARRRPRDGRDATARGWGGPARGWGERADREEVDPGWARQWGYVDREGRERRERWSEPPRYAGSAWTRAGGYGGEGYGRERDPGDRYYEPRSGWGDPSAWGAETGWEPAERWRGGGAAGGPHAGRGPRGYQRSDERIREDVCDALCEHGYIDASEIEVVVAGGEVTLTGTVRERPQKRLAEDAVEQVPGVRDVHNQLRVSTPGGDQDTSERPTDPRFRVA
jgi:hypothetical protein